MSHFPRMPGDDAIVSMIRAGVNTIPGIATKIFGECTGEARTNAKSKVLARLNALEKYGIVRRSGRVIQLGCGRNYAKIWEVVE